jgi:hypothetical protein
MRMKWIASGAIAALALAGCSSAAAARPSNPYCPAALAAIPATVPTTYIGSLDGMDTLASALTPKDRKLSDMLLTVAEAMGAIGRDEIAGGPTAGHLVSYHAAASAVRGYCRQ